MSHCPEGGKKKETKALTRFSRATGDDFFCLFDCHNFKHYCCCQQATLLSFAHIRAASLLKTTSLAMNLHKSVLLCLPFLWTT